MSARSPVRRCKRTTGAGALPCRTFRSLASRLAGSPPLRVGSTVITIWVGAPVAFGREDATPGIAAASAAAIIPVTPTIFCISQPLALFGAQHLDAGATFRVAYSTQ